MSIIARQSTARTVTVGPILDSDGAAVTGAVVGDLKIAKNGAAPAALNASATLTHRNTGHYSLALTASDLDTVGSAEIVIDKTTDAMPVKPITVIEEAIYDALFAASATGGLAVTLADGAITAAKIASDAITAAKIAADAVTGAKIAPGAIAKGDQLTGLNDLSIAGVSGAVWQTTATDYALLTSTMGYRVGTVISNLSTRLPAALVGGRMDSNVQAMADAVMTAAKFATDAITSTVLADSAVAKIEAALLNEGDGQALIDAIVQAVDAADISTNLTVALIRDGILNRVLAGNHDSAGTVGKVLQDASTSAEIAALEAHGDVTWATAAGFSTHSAADVWSATTRELSSTGVQAVVEGVWLAETTLTIASPDSYGHYLTTRVQDAVWSRTSGAFLVRNAARSYFFQMVDESGDLATGLTITAQRVLDSGSLEAASGTVAEIGFGWYRFDAAAADTDGAAGAWRFSATGAQDHGFSFVTGT